MKYLQDNIDLSHITRTLDVKINNQLRETMLSHITSAIRHPLTSKLYWNIHSISVNRVESYLQIY